MTEQVCEVAYKEMLACRWCPIKEAPYLLRDNDAELTLDTSDPAKLNPDIMPVGTVREFLVCFFNKAVNRDCIGFSRAPRTGRIQQAQQIIQTMCGDTHAKASMLKRSSSSLNTAVTSGWRI